MRRRRPHQVGPINRMAWGLDTEDRRKEVGRGWVLQEWQRSASGGIGACRRARPARGLGGREEELPESVLGESLCCAKEALGDFGMTLAAERPIQLQGTCRFRRRAVAAAGVYLQPDLLGSGVVATTVGLALRTQPLRAESDHVAGLGPRKEDEQQSGNGWFHARLPATYGSSLAFHLQFRAFCKIHSRAGHFAGNSDVLPFSISGATWRDLLSNHKKHKSHKRYPCRSKAVWRI